VQIWRAETFELLKRLASTATELWPGFAAFAALQERGLRDQALAAVRTFADEMRARPQDSRWEFVSWLLHQIDASRHVVLEALIPFPLKVEVVLPTLREACNAQLPCADAYLWMSRHFATDIVAECSNEADPRGSLLREGMRQAASDVRLSNALAVHLVGIVEDNQHHLFESKYLGDAAEDLQRLNEARALLGESMDAVKADIDRAEQLARAWQAYRAAGSNDFIAWCRQRSLTPPNGAAFYYDK
jgi:hypothetical protein